MNQKGIDAYNSGNYEGAVELFQEALAKQPGDSVVQQNLQKAKDQIAAQIAARKRQKEEEFNQEKQKAFGQLKGISEGAGFDSGPGLKDVPGSGDSMGLKTLPDVSTDTHVVDARKVPSGLPKSVDDAIASGYSGAPPGVSDRVRKGFQAIATHDWKLAKAWFGDALNHDPDNASLKRLVGLADYTEKRIQQGKAGTSTHSSSPRKPMQLPKDSDIQYLFPGWKPAEARPSSTSAGTQMQMPKDSDIEFLFPGLPALEARKMNDYMFDQALKDAENDPVLKKLSNRPDSRLPPNPYEVK